MGDSVTMLPKNPSRLGKGMKFGQLIIKKIIKIVAADVRF